MEFSFYGNRISVCGSAISVLIGTTGCLSVSVECWDCIMGQGVPFHLDCTTLYGVWEILWKVINGMRAMWKTNSLFSMQVHLSMHPPIQPITKISIYPIIQMYINSSSLPFIHSCNCLFIHQSIHSHICPHIHPYTSCPPVYPSFHSSTNSATPVHLFTYSPAFLSIHLPTQPPSLLSTYPTIH
jgi:hypothetical protein